MICYFEHCQGTPACWGDFNHVPAVTGREAPEANNAANEPRGKAVDAFDELNQSGMAQVDTHKASFAPQTVSAALLRQQEPFDACQLQQAPLEADPPPL